MESGLKTITHDKVNEIIRSLYNEYEPLGFEFHPFKVGWYNDQVDKWFQIPYHYDTVAIIMISTPKMFEKSFIPYLFKNISGDFGRDPIDECMKFQAKNIIKKLGFDMKCIHDFELMVRNRPSIIIQTAAHVSGAAYCYQKKDLKCTPWDVNEKINGVCIHPKYGGWFALRGVFILRDTLCVELPYIPPQNVVPDDDTRVKLLQLYNYEWSNYKFRDIIPVVERYSDLQKLYFSTKPEERMKLLARIQNRPDLNDDL